jgi:DNA polymerase-3 subunit gamma/tau
MRAIAASFSEEDLTRYLQLSLDLFRDLQFSLQPRFHLEIGLLKMVQAGKLIAIEDALAALPAGDTRSVSASVQAQPAPKPQLQPKIVAAPAPPPPVPPVAPPSPTDDWRQKMHTAMREAGLTFSADAIAQSDVALINNELIVTAPKSFQLDLGREEIMTALKQLGHAGLRFKVVFGEVKSSAPPVVQKPAQAEDEVTGRALAHPEVQRFREVFGGEVRAVRNLKEP